VSRVQVSSLKRRNVILKDKSFGRKEDEPCMGAKTASCVMNWLKRKEE